MFLSTHENKLDKKGRVSVPASFRSYLSSMGYNGVICYPSFTNPSIEGEATALYLERIFKDWNGKLTRLGRGLPIGGELEYADPETLKQSLENRR